MTGLEHHAGFNLTSNKLQFVEISLKADEFVVDSIDEVYLNEFLNLKDDKETKIVSILQAAYDELIIKKPLNSSAVSFSLPLDVFISLQLPLETSLLHQDIIEEFKWEFSVIYPHLKIDDYIFQYFEVEKNRFIKYNSAIVSAVPRKVLQVLHTFCKSNKLHLRFVDNVHFASDKAIILNQNFILDGIVLSLYISDKTVSIELIEAGLPVFYNVVRLDSISQLNDQLNDLFTNGSLQSFDKKMIESVFLSGDEISLTFIQSFEENFGIRTYAVQSFGKISVDPVLFDAKYYSDRFFTFSSAAGISYRLA
jgi:Tfp pilus assembly PilM family ATPase